MRRLAIVTGVAVLLLSVTAVATPAAFAVDMFIKIAGVDGEAQDKDYRGWIEVVDFTWNLTAAQEAVSHRSAGKRKHAPLVAVKLVDKTSPKLAKLARENTRIDTLRVAVRQGREPYMEFSLNDVRVAGVTLREDQGDERGVEEVSFDYRRIEWSKR